MTPVQVHSRLQELLVSMGISLTALTDQANFMRDLGFDSLDITDLLVQVENVFNIRIPDEDWFKLQTVGQLKDYLVTEVVFE